MNNNIQKLYEYTNNILDNDIEYSNCQIDYILQNSTNYETYLLVSDGDEKIFEFELSNDKYSINRIPEWDYNLDDYLFNKLENNKEIVTMRDDVHYGVWNIINEFYPNDIEHKNGVKKYVDYCRRMSINKYGLDKKLNVDTPDIMKIFKKKTEIER